MSLPLSPLPCRNNSKGHLYPSGSDNKYPVSRTNFSAVCCAFMPVLKNKTTKKRKTGTDACFNFIVEKL
jgi:hypothetical protein